MKTVNKQSNRKAAFTIVELLTVMSIIVILIGLLVPALNRVKIFAMEVKQNAQFHSMNTANELFNNAFDGYPDSSALDPDNESYCGAMKLCEAMMGQDLLGFHTNSIFDRGGMDVDDTVMLYADKTDLSARRGPFLPAESANVFKMDEIYPTDTGGFLADTFVLCDVFTHKLASGKKAGMPIVYYRADTTGSFHDPTRSMTPSNNAGNIYNYWDNLELIALGKPWVSGGAGTPEKKHKLEDIDRFYKNTLSDKVITMDRPYKADSFILISAGYDREYGTADDICNFEWRYKN